jgi:hypothetical protein
MTKPAKKYRITEAVRGSFVGAGGRVRYDVEPGLASEKDLDPEVLATLLAAGYAVDPDAPLPSDPGESEPELAGEATEEDNSDGDAPAPAESEESE